MFHWSVGYGNQSSFSMYGNASSQGYGAAASPQTQQTSYPTGYGNMNYQYKQEVSHTHPSLKPPTNPLKLSPRGKEDPHVFLYFHYIDLKLINPKPSVIFTITLFPKPDYPFLYLPCGKCNLNVSNKQFSSVQGLQKGNNNSAFGMMLFWVIDFLFCSSFLKCISLFFLYFFYTFCFSVVKPPEVECECKRRICSQSFKMSVSKTCFLSIFNLNHYFMF